MSPLLSLVLVPLLAALAAGVVAWFTRKSELGLQPKPQLKVQSAPKPKPAALNHHALGAILVLATLVQAYSLWQLYNTLVASDTSAWVPSFGVR